MDPKFRPRLARMLTIEVLMKRTGRPRDFIEVWGMLADDCPPDLDTFLDGGPTDPILQFKAVYRDVEDTLAAIDAMGFRLECG